MTGHTSWVLVSTALVLLMTPGVALFYGGMNRTKGVVNVMMMCFSAIGVVTLLWVLYGFSLAFGGSTHGVVGDLSMVGLRGLIEPGAVAELPVLAFAGFQMMFAVITVALVAGAVADRARFGAWVLFSGLWCSVVYFPVAHWVWGTGGWLNALGVLDFAGGTAVHINAGAAALALVLVLGRRVGWPWSGQKPHSLPLVLLGAGLLWFGWFGFNAGSELAANGTAAVAVVNTQVAAAVATLGWIAVEWTRHRPTSLGAVSGAISGLVAITPACAFVEPLGAVAIGLIAGVISAGAVHLKFKLGYDDSLDVVGVHLVAGVVGSLLVGVLATPVLSDQPGLLYGGGLQLLGVQAVGVGSVLVYSFVMTYIIGMMIHKSIGFRVEEHIETEGIDFHEHSEWSYTIHH